MSYFSMQRWLWLVVVAAPLSGSAQSIKTRLMILMDNSNSMHETTTGLDIPNPDGSYDLDPSWLTDGGSTADGGTLQTCDLAKLQDAGYCKSKFCSAKCVLYNAMDPFEEDFEFGFATYNTYRRKTTFSLGSTTCSYDVLAGPGENLPGGTSNRFWTFRSDLAPTCAITRVASAGSGVRSDTSYGSDNRYICNNKPGDAGYDPPKNCTSVATLPVDWYTNNGSTTFDIFRNDKTGAAGGAAIASTVAGTTATCTATDAGFTCTSSNSAAIFPTAGGANEPTQSTSAGRTYYLRTVQDFPSTTGSRNTYTSTSTDGGCIGAADTIGSTTAALTGGPPGTNYSSSLSSLVSNGTTGCSASRPCVWTLINKQPVPTGNTVNTATCNANTPPTSGSPPAWVAGSPTTSTTTTTSGTYYSSPSCPATTLACPAQSATCASAPASCSVPAGTPASLSAEVYAQLSYDKNAVSPPAGYTIGTATTAATWLDSSVQVTSVSQCAATKVFTGTAPTGQACGTSFTGRCEFHTPVYVPIPGDSTKGNCRYTLYSRNFTRPRWTCQYTFTQYRFTQTIPNPPVIQCSWGLRRYTWRPQLYRYDWTTVGGEYVSTVSTTLDAVNKVCNNSPVQFPSPAPTSQCPAKLNASNVTAPAACKMAGRECRLRWWAKPGTGAPAEFASYNLGRNSRFSRTTSPSTAAGTSSGYYGSSTPPYCQAVDYLNAPVQSEASLVSQPFGVAQATSAANWCRGTGVSGPSTDTLTLGDPYAPGMPNYPLASSWFGTYRGATLLSSEYSIDPAGATWQATPILPQKSVGWSRLPNGTPMLGLFHDFDPLGLPVVRNLILRLPMHDDPLQLNYQTMAQSWINGSNTPLYGTLRDYQQHLQDTLDPVGSLGPDDQAQCRFYGVVLLTDGDENQPARQPNHPQATTGPCDPYTTANCQAFTDYAAGTYLPDVIDTIRSTNGGTPERTPKGVRSYVVSYGNGATSTVLDVMARRAGTAINPVTGTLDLTSGEAYKPQTADDLRAAFQAIANSFGNARLSRSKPVLVRDAYSSMIYTGSFQFDSSLGAREWYGYLDAYDISALGPGSQTATWSFDQKLLAQSSSTRRIYTYLPALNTMVDVNATLSTAQKDELKTRIGFTTGSTTDSIFQATLNTVLNPNPSPGAPFAFSAKTRTSRLAAIVNSSPAVFGPPRAANNWPGEASEEPAYAAFKSNYANRETRVIAGSNDGIVHAVCEPTNGITPACTRGNEVWGFIPPAVHDRLDDLHNNMVSEYTSNGSFGGGDVCFSNCAPTTGFGGWFSMLLGSMHRGSPTFFALDVTNPNLPAYKWTYSSSLLGQTWSAPTIIRAVVDMPLAMGGPGQKRWIGLAGAGYKQGNQWGTQSNGLVAIDLATGTTLIDNTSSGSCTNAYGITKSPCNQAIYRVDQNAFACDAQASGTATSVSCPRYRNSVPARVGIGWNQGSLASAAYFGDVQGRVSVSRLDTPKVADWQPQKLFDPTLAACKDDIFGTSGGTPIFDAADAIQSVSVDTLPLAEDNEDGSYAIPSREVRSIYQRVLVDTMSNGLKYVFAGTGTEARANEADTYDYLYAIEDSKLTGATCAGRPVWVKRLPAGEKVISEMASAAGVLFVSTFLPSTTDPCSQLGHTVLYAFYQATGRPALVFNTTGARVHRTVIENTGIPADTTLVKTSDSTVDVLVRTQDADHRFQKQGASGLLQPGRIRNWRRVR